MNNPNPDNVPVLKLCDTYLKDLNDFLATASYDVAKDYRYSKKAALKRRLQYGPDSLILVNENTMKVVKWEDRNKR